MGLPKKSNIKKHIPLTESKTLLPRRYELLDKINKDGTYLPKSLLHADLDGGFLNFVKTELETIVDGKKIPMIDILITTQNWSQFIETWDIQNLDKNVEPPIITVVRIPEVKFGTNPAVVYNIPNRRQYFYAQVPTFNGQRNGMDIYKIPQPVPIDITYQVKIVCNRMRELNKFNQIILEKFASKQAYATIKGHYIPIVQGGITDESVNDLEKRRYYIQSYEFTMLGFLIDEDEFEVSPAISRVLQVTELSTDKTKKRKKFDSNASNTTMNILFVVGNNTITQLFDYTVNLNLGENHNIDTYDVYINNQYYGSDITEVQINTNDVFKIIATKKDDTLEASIVLNNHLL
jgi:hypothetical protein